MSSIRKLAADKILQMNNQIKEYEKRAHAERLIYKQAEMGYGEIPRSFDDFQTKIASLLKQDLYVLEKAMELAGGNVKLGELDRNDHNNLGGGTASQVFMASILEDTY